MSAAGTRCRYNGSLIDYRIERDSLGEVRIPTAALWGAQIQWAVENFLAKW